MSKLALPSYRPGASVSRPSADRVNSMQPQKQTLTVAGRGEIVPLVYGQAEVGGPIIAGPKDLEGGTVVYYAIALSYGPINRIMRGIVGSEKAVINKAPTAAGMYHVVSGDGYRYECMFYDGTQTIVDPRLAANITDFADVFKDVAYVSIKMTGENANVGDIHFEVQGRKVLDPRTNKVAYTENPALHMHDFVTNQTWGLRRNMQGTEALANECDRTMSYGPKSRVNNVIVSSSDEPGYLNLFAMYAEALFGFSGGDVIVVPDTAVDEADIIDIPASQIRLSTIRLSSRSAENIPDSITMIYGTADDDGIAKPPAYASIEQTDPSNPVVNSTMSVAGIERGEEAQRRVGTRLAQLQLSGRISFQMFDSGAYFKVGDVVRMPDVLGLAGLLFRITSDPAMVARGEYQLSGESYSSSVYLLPVGASSVPAGAVLFRVDDSVPAGTTRLQNLGMVSGAASGLSTTGDSDKQVPEPVVAAAGEHQARYGRLDTYLLPDSNINGSGSSGFRLEVLSETAVHKHEVEQSGSVGIGLYERFNMRAVRASRELLSIPVNTVFFSREQLEDNAIFTKALAVGLLSVANGEVGETDLFRFALSYEGMHRHRYGRLNRTPVGGRRTATHRYASVGAGVLHNHKAKVIGADAQQVKRRRVGAYITSKTDSVIPIGGIIGFTLSGPAPVGWAICDGENGTVDLRGAFIDVGGIDGEGVSDLADIVMTGVELEEDGEHDHNSRSGQPSYTMYVKNTAHTMGDIFNHSPDDAKHLHDLSWPEGNPFPITVKPRYTKLRFIQYIGE